MKNILFLPFFIVFLCQQVFARVADSHLDTSTRYPIVLIHGLLGYGHKSPLLARYFGDIPKLLADHGATVYIADVNQANAIEKRGEQLHEQLVHFGHRRYHLIGHSQGGLDARYVLGKYPDIVASVTTIGSPHHGSKVADFLVKKMADNVLFDAFSRVAGNFLGHLIAFLSGNLHEQNIVSALSGLTTDAMKDFNKKFPLGISNAYCRGGAESFRGRRLYSWGSYGVEPQTKHDIFGQLLLKASKVFDDGELNDGLVSLCSMKFGKWLGEVPRGAHHLVPVGGIVSPISEEHHKWSSMMFLKHVHRLKSLGL